MLKIAYAPIYHLPLPEGHRFPMIKYDLIVEQLLYEGIITAENLFLPEPVSDEVILWTHTLAYWRALQQLTLSPKEQRKIGLPMSERLVERTRYISGGTVAATHFARQYGVAFNAAGGTHHAYADRGEGFCLLNDQAVAANYLLHTTALERILILDLDVHQGNGTAAIFANEPRVFTFSLHGEKNYPTRKELSDWDIGLPDGTPDAAYLQTLEHALHTLQAQVQPEFVFYLAGVDVLATDKLGRLSLSPEGCRQRDERVLRWCQTLGVPVVVTMGGGYSYRVADTVNAHTMTYKVARDIFF